MRDVFSRNSRQLAAVLAAGAMAMHVAADSPVARHKEHTIADAGARPAAPASAEGLTRGDRAAHAVRERLARVTETRRPAPATQRVLRSTGKGVRSFVQVSTTDADHVVTSSVQTAIAREGPPGNTAGLLCQEPAANCQTPNTLDAIVSDRVAFVVADNFTPNQNGNVTSICWWGAYFDGTADCEGVAPDTFEVRYYRDAGGFPGELVEFFSQAGLTLTVSGPAATGDVIADLVPEYEYRATHNPVPVFGGQCYWVEISNALSGCTWFWEIADQRDGWAMQDGDGIDPPNGYDGDDPLAADLAFCLDVGLGDPAGCAPPPPANDDCSDATEISGQGAFAFDNLTATTDGPRHNACLAFTEDQLEGDVWYRWTAPCTDIVFIATCGSTDVDTRIAVYEGWGCPPTDERLLSCNDDLCGDPGDPRQSMVFFDALQGQQYLVRIGTYPGERHGAGSFAITCGPPDHQACPGSESCCLDTGALGCENEACCEAVCACDPFCCEVAWDAMCATIGDNTGCGAALLCGDLCQCGTPSSGDCCEGNGTPGCSDALCCAAVCEADPFCCQREWDVDCATYGYEGEGNGALVLCPELCPTCADGPVAFVDPPSGTIDARQPSPPNNAANRQGIDAIVVAGPSGVGLSGCWLLCETAVDSSPNSVADVVDNGDGTYTLVLTRPISPGALTTITYSSEAGGSYSGTFVSQPANVDGDSVSDTADVLALIGILSETAVSQWGVYSEDIDHSGRTHSADILRVIDLLNGAEQLPVWLGRPSPDCGGCCP